MMSLRKKIFLGVGAILLVIVGYIGYIMFTTRSPSPAEEVTYEQEGLSFQIDYCKPYKKDRLIFGTIEEGALLPFGKYWRLGANDATKLTLETDIDFGGQELPKGSYSLYAFPEADYWVIGINSEADRRGGSPPDFSQDLGRIKVPVIEDSKPMEQFTISVEESGSEVFVVMQWDRTQVRVPISATD